MNESVLIHEKASIKDALKQLNKAAEKVLLVVDRKKKLLGTLTDGDMRRYIMKGSSLEKSIDIVYHRNPFFINKKDYSFNSAREILVREKIELLPILDKEGKVINYVTWDQVISETGTVLKTIKQLDIPVVIMAGGEGTRLEPFTKIIPKPLIPIGDKPFIEMIIDEFKGHGINEYYITLNYKAEIIKAFFNGIDKDYKIKFIHEDNYYGTAGSLKMLPKKISDIFIVSNCDVIVKADFEDVLKFHKESNAYLTALSSIQHYKIPYGVVKFTDGGNVTEIIEKPEYTFTINTGVYVLSKDALNYIPVKKRFDMTDLISILIKNKKKVVTYPVNEDDYIDIGQLEEYRKVFEKLKLL